jgi:hypothetical protein
LNPSSTEVTETATSVGTGDAGARGHGLFREGRGPSAAHELIKRFNDMLGNLPADSGYSHVRYVNLLGTLSGDDDYRDWWDNELHTTEKGFKAVTRKIADELRRLS